MVGVAVALLYLGTAVPYLLNAYNPLVGGPRLAVHVMPMGWGEAVSAAAQWLAEQPDAAEKKRLWRALVRHLPRFSRYYPAAHRAKSSRGRLCGGHPCRFAGG